MEPPRYPQIWQCVGMVVGVYGVGYWIASRDPLRHWPITLVGLLGKVFGPIGFLWMTMTRQPGDEGYLPLAWGWMIVTNDLVWWIPFAAILYQSFKSATAPESPPVMTMQEANRKFRSQHGRTIDELSDGKRIVLLFLRHQGCTFCREALSELARQREQLAAMGVTPVLVHMGDNEKSKSFFAGYGLDDLDRISDPNCALYKAYELTRGRASQLFGLRVWWPGFRAFVVKRHGVGKLEGDGFQMPGGFYRRKR